MTPRQLDAGKWCVPGSACSAGQTPTYGTIAFALDRNRPGTVYLGTSGFGIWKTTNCGADWEKVNTGTSAQALDAGRNWSILIDPTNSNVLYTVTGYAGAGFYKSTNGGRDWVQKFPAAMLATFPGQGIEKLAMDPGNPQHLTATFHSPCSDAPGGGNWACMAETFDGGESFTRRPSAFDWTEGDGQTMIDATTWFFSTGGGDIWRTDSAGNWAPVYSGFSRGDYTTSGCIYTLPDGSFITGGSRGMVTSRNGIDWVKVPNAPSVGGPNGGCSMVSDGTYLYASMGLIAYAPPGETQWIWRAPLGNLSSWSAYPAPAVVTGAGWLAYDSANKLLYASNSTGGFYRVVVK